MNIVKLITKIRNFGDVQKSLQELERQVNELKDSVNVKAEGEVSDKDGKTGDIRTTRNVNGTYTFEIRTDEGWKTPAIGESLITFKDKPSSYSQKIVKTIDEIEADDAITGDTKAKKVIFDEKDGKFIMPRPDYDSGWFDAVSTKLYITGATDGVAPNTSSIMHAAHIIGIPALGFQLTALPLKWEVLISHTGTTDWDDIAAGTTDSWVTLGDYGDEWFSAHSSGDDHMNGVKVFLTSDEHFVISTSDENLLYWFVAGGLNVTESSAALRLRVWK